MPALTCRRALLAVSLLHGAVCSADADGNARPFVRAPHVRTTEAYIRDLLEDGLRLSPTVRALAARLDDSDLIVYLRSDWCAPRGFAGRLTFVSNAGGWRYVVVRLAGIGSRAQQLAILGHELQHAVEIAGNAAIVDSTSMLREYAQLGQIRTAGLGIVIDTDAAVAVERRVRAEAVSGGRQRARLVARQPPAQGMQP